MLVAMSGFFTPGGAALPAGERNLNQPIERHQVVPFSIAVSHSGERLIRTQ
jgi:hypothetical protein